MTWEMEHLCTISIEPFAGKYLILPILLGNTASLSILLCTQLIKCSMYVGAAILVGRLKFSESCHRYSNLQESVYSSIHNMIDLLIGGLHLGTGLGRAELGDGAVKEIDVIVEIDHWSVLSKTT